MPKRGETLPFKVRSTWPGAKPWTSSFHSADAALNAAIKQANVVGHDSERANCLVVVWDARNPQVTRVIPCPEDEDDGVYVCSETGHGYHDMAHPCPSGTLV